jgi:hypothetical protein
MQVYLFTVSSICTCAKRTCKTHYKFCLKRAWPQNQVHHACIAHPMVSLNDTTHAALTKQHALFPPTPYVQV